MPIDPFCYGLCNATFKDAECHAVCKAKQLSGGHCIIQTVYQNLRFTTWIFTRAIADFRAVLRSYVHRTGTTVDQMLIEVHKAKEIGADIVAIRLDCLRNFNPQADLEILIKQSAYPLVTYSYR